MKKLDDTTIQKLEEEAVKKQEEASSFFDGFGYDALNIVGEVGRVALDVSGSALSVSCDVGAVACEVTGAVLSGVAEVLGGLG